MLYHISNTQIYILSIDLYILSTDSHYLPVVAKHFKVCTFFDKKLEYQTSNTNRGELDSEVVVQPVDWIKACIVQGQLII